MRRDGALSWVKLSWDNKEGESIFPSSKFCRNDKLTACLRSAKELRFKCDNTGT
jgi:hypothetical protein